MSKTKENPPYEQLALDLEAIKRPSRRLSTSDDVSALHRALEPFIDLPALRRGIAEGKDIYEALRVDKPPRELRMLLDTLTVILTPQKREKIRQPSDLAAILMVEMGHLQQEELRTVLLDTKNHILDIVTVYKGSVDTALIRVGEVYKEAVRQNSTSIIVAHNHPSGTVDPSHEDISVTREIIDAGKLLDITCLDHFVIGRGAWLSMREKGYAFNP